MTAQEFEQAMSDSAHTLVEVEARNKGEHTEDIISIRLVLSNGRRIVIEPATTSYGDPDLFLNIEEEST